MIGRQTLDSGIPADHWAACMHWSQMNSTFRVDYYFTGTPDVCLSPLELRHASTYTYIYIKHNCTLITLHATLCISLHITHLNK